MIKKIAIATDHGGVDFKDEIKKYLSDKGYEVIDFGKNDTNSVDYPDMAVPVCSAVNDGKCDKGILICGTGIGMSLAANKVKGIRATLISDSYSAKMASLHNNANVVCIGARVIGVELAKDMLDSFLNTEFEGGRHAKRVEKIMNLEK